VIISPLLLLVFPVRLALFLFGIFLSWLCCLFGGKQRRFIERSHVFISRLLLFACGVWPGLLRVEGRLDRRAPIIVIAPHLGLYDMFCMMYTARCPRPIAMATWGKNPLIRAIFDAVDGIGVRFTPNCTTPANQATAKVAPLPAEAITATKPRSGAAAVREAIVEHKRDFCTGEKPIVILPEGTTSNGRALLKFFSGAFEGGGTVQPVLLTYSFSHYNAAAFITSAPAHVGRALLNAPPCRQS
jgi:1-acyl-sn-glycerol-3-phosphate acyltransferase